MGEVRVRVKLTNAGDEVMVRRGLLPADQVRHFEADALVDSGAVRSVLPRHVVQLLGLAMVGRTRATYANDRTEDVDIAEVVGIDINGRRTTEETLVLGSEVLIGQTVLESLDLLIDCTNRCVVGNPAHPDQPVIKIKWLHRAGTHDLPRFELVNMSDWYPFKNGESVGQKGSESGEILRDDEHSDGARVTLEHVRNNQFTITCGIYGWMVHTRFFDSEPSAQMGFEETKDEFAKILALIPMENEANDGNIQVASAAISDFVDRCE